MWVVVPDYFCAIPEDYVASSDWAGLAFARSDVGVFAASHGEEEGCADECGSGYFAGKDGHHEDVFEDYWREGFFVFGGWVASLVSFCLSLDVVVSVASWVGDWAWPMTLHKGRCHMAEGLSRSGSLDGLDG